MADKKDYKDLLRQKDPGKFFQIIQDAAELRIRGKANDGRILLNSEEEAKKYLEAACKRAVEGK